MVYFTPLSLSEIDNFVLPENTVVLGRVSHKLPYMTSLARSLGKFLILTDFTNIFK